MFLNAGKTTEIKHSDILIKLKKQMKVRSQTKKMFDYYGNDQSVAKSPKIKKYETHKNNIFIT